MPEREIPLTRGSSRVKDPEPPDPDDDHRQPSNNSHQRPVSKNREAEDIVPRVPVVPRRPELRVMFEEIAEVGREFTMSIIEGNLPRWTARESQAYMEEIEDAI